MCRIVTRATLTQKTTTCEGALAGSRGTSESLREDSYIHINQTDRIGVGVGMREWSQQCFYYIYVCVSECVVCVSLCECV